MLVLVLCALIAAVFYAGVYEPATGRANRVLGEIQRLDAEIFRYQEQSRQFHDLMRKVRTLDHQTLEPDSPGTNRGGAFSGRNLRQLVTQAARKHGLQVLLWQPDPPLSTPIVAEQGDQLPQQAIRVRVEGGYYRVAQLFEDMLSWPQVLNIRRFSMAMAPGGSRSAQLHTDFTLTTMKGVWSRPEAAGILQEPFPEAVPVGS